MGNIHTVGPNEALIVSGNWILSTQLAISIIYNELGLSSSVIGFYMQFGTPLFVRTQ